MTRDTGAAGPRSALDPQPGTATISRPISTPCNHAVSIIIDTDLGLCGFISCLYSFAIVFLVRVTDARTVPAFSAWYLSRAASRM